MKKRSPLVSVIMNSHNGEKFLRESLNSLFQQSYNNWELVFFDNKSSDNSLKILKNYDKKKIRYFYSKKKLKLYDARNQAIKKAKGKFITFLDTDDLWSKKKLEIQINFFKNNPRYDILYSNYFIKDLNKNLTYKKHSKTLPSGRISQLIIKEYVIAILTVMINKRIIIRNKFNKDYEIIGDFDLFFRLSQKFKIGCIQKPLAYYGIHDDNFSKKKGIYIKELSSWLNKNQKKLKNRNYDSSRINFLILKLKVKNLVKRLFNLNLGV